MTITLTDDQPAAPQATNLGALAAPGPALSGQSLAAGQVRWWSFNLPVSVSAALQNHLDIDTFGSSLPVSGGSLLNDTVIGLYSATGDLVAFDDDSGDGFTSQLSFGQGGRPPRGDGRPFGGQNGALPAGTYYLAVGAFPMQCGATRWEAISTGVQTGSISLTFGYDPLPYCYANCDGSTGAPLLTANDFTCFINAYASNTPYANCDGSTGTPALTGNDFICFIAAYVAWCP